MIWNAADGSKVYVFYAKVVVPKYPWTALCSCPYGFGTMVAIGCSNSCLFIFAVNGDENLLLDLRSSP